MIYIMDVKYVINILYILIVVSFLLRCKVRAIISILELLESAVPCGNDAGTSELRVE